MPNLRRTSLRLAQLTSSVGAFFAVEAEQVLPDALLCFGPKLHISQRNLKIFGDDDLDYDLCRHQFCLHSMQVQKRQIPPPRGRTPYPPDLPTHLEEGALLVSFWPSPEYLL